MAHWIFIEPGDYWAEAAYLITPGHTAMALEDVVVEVYLDANDERRVKGQGMGFNLQLVELLEDHDEIDMLLDLGGDFKYLLKTPTLRGGKLFAPDVKAKIQYIAIGPLEKLSQDKFAEIHRSLEFVGKP